MSPRHVYVHVPFCARRCSYCDFAIAVRRAVPAEEYRQAVLAELAIRGIRWTAPATTLYLGGGTPSRLGGEGLASLVQALRDQVSLEAGAEVTIEVNPEDVDPAAARAWRGAGVNRASVGVQSFDPAVLAWMHRGHGADRARAAVDCLRDAGIQNISVDLIYAVPSTLGRDWSRDLDQALGLLPDHLSCYGLTVEPSTPLARWVERGDIAPARDEVYEADFLRTHAQLSASGFEHYEVSNYALVGKRSQHNSAYWSGAAYLGLGPSAHGFEGRIRRWNIREYTAWRAAVDRARDPLADFETLTDEQVMIEGVYLGLRSDQGVVCDPRDLPVTNMWVEQGWALNQGGRLRLTASGWLRLDALASALTMHRSRY